MISKLPVAYISLADERNIFILSSDGYINAQYALHFKQLFYGGL